MLEPAATSVSSVMLTSPAGTPSSAAIAAASMFVSVTLVASTRMATVGASVPMFSRMVAVMWTTGALVADADVIGGDRDVLGDVDGDPERVGVREGLCGVPVRDAVPVADRVTPGVTAVAEGLRDAELDALAVADPVADAEGEGDTEDEAELLGDGVKEAEDDHMPDGEGSGVREADGDISGDVCGETDDDDDGDGDSCGDDEGCGDVDGGGVLFSDGDVLGVASRDRVTVAVPVPLDDIDGVAETVADTDAEPDSVGETDVDAE